MKKIISLILVLVFVLTTTAFAHPFSDVAGHWAEAEIEKGFQDKIISGDGDGKFRPEGTVTRGEFLKMMVEMVCGKMSQVNGQEITVPDEIGDGSHWASKYYIFASAYMYAPLGEEVNGLSVGEMKAAADYDKAIPRFEMAYMLGETSRNLLGDITTKVLAYNDNNLMTEYPQGLIDNISVVSSLGFMKGDENGNFAPEANGTRAEAVTVINRAGAYLQGIIDAITESEGAYRQELETNRVTYTDIPKGHPIATIIMEDNKKIEIELYPEYAPQTVANFVKLAKDGFYDGTTFHRVVEGFMAQGGIPANSEIDGSGKYIIGEFVANGYSKNTLKHERGTISMARSNEPNSASSQFFICYDDATSLDGMYAAFGKVKSGMEVVDSFTKVELATNELGEKAAPVKPIKVKKITIK